MIFLIQSAQGGHRGGGQGHFYRGPGPSRSPFRTAPGANGLSEVKWNIQKWNRTGRWDRNHSEDRIFTGQIKISWRMTRWAASQMWARGSRKEKYNWYNVLLAIAMLSFSTSVLNLNQSVWVPASRYDWWIPPCCGNHHYWLYNFCQPNVHHNGNHCRCVFWANTHRHTQTHTLLYSVTLSYQVLGTAWPSCPQWPSSLSTSHANAPW